MMNSYTFLLEGPGGGGGGVIEFRGKIAFFYHLKHEISDLPGRTLYCSERGVPPCIQEPSGFNTNNNDQILLKLINAPIAAIKQVFPVHCSREQH